MRTSSSPPKQGATNTRAHSEAEAPKPDRLPVCPVMSCTVRGLSCPLRCLRGGELLPRHFTLTLLRRGFEERYIFCDTFRHSFSRKSAPVFTGHTVVRCPDFPLNAEGIMPRHPPIVSGPFPPESRRIFHPVRAKNSERYQEKGNSLLVSETPATVPPADRQRSRKGMSNLR